MDGWGLTAQQLSQGWWESRDCRRGSGLQEGRRRREVDGYHGGHCGGDLYEW